MRCAQPPRQFGGVERRYFALCSIRPVRPGKGTALQGPYKIIDCNRHVVEPRDLWEQRLRAPLSQQVHIGPGRLDSIQVRGRPVLRGRPNFFTDPTYQKILAAAIQADFSPQSNLADMDREGIDVGVLLPVLGLYAPWVDHIGPDLSVPMCQVYNDWLYEYCQADVARLKGVALLPLQDPGEAAKELPPGRAGVAIRSRADVPQSGHRTVASRRCVRRALPGGRDPGCAHRGEPWGERHGPAAGRSGPLAGLLCPGSGGGEPRSVDRRRLLHGGQRAGAR